MAIYSYIWKENSFNMKKNRIALISNLLLLLTAIIWGFAFVAQSVGMNYVGPWTFVFSRFIIAAILLLPLSAFSEKSYRASLPEVVDEKHYKTEALLGGAGCGLCLGAASITQQIGMQTTTPGKAGFITACYVVIVPVLGIFIGKKPKKTIWLSVALALIGLYLISMHGGMTIERGDAMVSLCALLFSFQIISVDHFSEKVNPIRLSNIQFFFASVVGLVGMLLFERPDMTGILGAMPSILYAGVLSSAVGYTLQVLAQKNTDPTIASLLMSLESVFSVVGGFLILHQMLSMQELIGCVSVFAAVIIAQLV